MSRRTTATSSVLSEADRVRLQLPAPEPYDPIGTWRTARARLLAWTWRHRLSLVVLVPLLVGTAVVRMWGLSHGPALSDDEGTYLAQAWAVQHLHSLAPYTYWYDHPPFGWLQLSAWTSLTHTFGGNDLAIVSARRLMVAYAVVDAGLLYAFARRLGMHRALAGLAVAAWGLSPLAVGMSRMVYLDNLAMPWLLGAFVLAASPRRDLWANVGAGLCFAGAVLTKETSVLLLPALVLLLWQRSVRQTRTFCLTGFASGFVLLSASYPLLAVLKGELLPGPGHVSLLEALDFQFFSRPSTGSVLSASSGSRQVLTGWLSLDGLLVAAGVLACVPVLLCRRYRPVGLALALMLVAIVRPGYLPEPLVITVLPFAALAVAAAGDLAWEWSRTVPLGLRFAGAGAVCAALLVGVGPAWAHGNQVLDGNDQSAATRSAERWLEAHHQRGRLLVDDTVWTDLVSHGYSRSQVVWFYKLDFANNLDPSVRQQIRRYSDFDVVLSTPVIRAALQSNTTRSLTLVREALTNSTVLTTFGSGSERVEIRAITHTSQGA
ncbi:MAG: putative rane protein [Frankiales bacterium]|nr:putative rane protein [Frankiales bacterium]